MFKKNPKTDDSKEDSDSIYKSIPVFEHIKEIRKRLVFLVCVFLIVFVVSFINAKHIYMFLIYPLQALSPNNNVQLIYTALQEAFLTYVKLAFFSSIFIVLPFLFNQIWLFISPALYHHEKKTFRMLFILSPLLFWLGAIVAYLWVIPTAWKFFLGFEFINDSKNVSINLLPKLNEYLSLSLHLIIAFAVCFLIPIIIFLLVKIRILDISHLKKGRRYAIVFAFIIAAIATPPDPASQIIMAITIILLYEFSIILLKIYDKNLPEKVVKEEEK